MLLKEKEFKIKPFKKVRIGDPWYFESIEEGAKGREKDLVCDLPKIPFSNREARVVLREHEDFYGDGPNTRYKYYEVIFGSFKKTDLGKDLFNVHKKGQWAPNLCKDHKDLGCDTARFEITVDDNYDEIRTMADGYYGDFFHYVNNEAFIFSFTLDEDAISWERLESEIRYLFDVIKEEKASFFTHLT